MTRGGEAGASVPVIVLRGAPGAFGRDAVRGRSRTADAERQIGAAGRCNRACSGNVESSDGARKRLVVSSAEDGPMQRIYVFEAGLVDFTDVRSTVAIVAIRRSTSFTTRCAPRSPATTSTSRRSG